MKISDEDKETVKRYISKNTYRVTGIVHDNARAIFFTRQYRNTVEGGMGFMHCMDNRSILGSIIETGEQWLLSHHCHHYYAPINFNTWYAYRTITGKMDAPLLPFETTLPPYMNALLIDRGFEAEEKHYTFIIQDTNHMLNSLYKAYMHARDQGYEIRTETDLSLVMSDIYSIAISSFKDASLFDRIDFSEFLHIFSNSSRAANARLFTARNNNAIEGFIMIYELDNAVVLKTIASLDSASAAYIAPMLIYHVYKLYESEGINTFYHAYMRSDISTVKFSQRHGKMFREYTLYGKTI